MSVNALPILETRQPASIDEVVECVAAANAARRPLYIIGGGSSPPDAIAARAEGDALEMSACRRIIDYPARDMTITVQAGATMSQIAAELASEGQQLPLDVPHPEQATIGGVVAANWNGPRRYGLGTVRDYVIGVEAVDGRGVRFKGGGQVVKNVAGYDFCKLLTGSHGVLGVITQVTLKVKPLPAARRCVIAACGMLDDAERVLASQVDSPVPLVALELLAGSSWRKSELGVLQIADDTTECLIVAIVEGTQIEVDWSVEQLQQQWRDQGATPNAVEIDDAAWEALVEFPSQRAALTLKANLRSSGVMPFVDAVMKLDSNASVQAHAGNGVVLAAFDETPADGVHAALAKSLRPVAARYDGSVVVLASDSAADATHQTVWGAPSGEQLMEKLKRQFDPNGVLNPGRFLFTHL